MYIPCTGVSVLWHSGFWLPGIVQETPAVLASALTAPWFSWLPSSSRFFDSYHHYYCRCYYYYLPRLSSLLGPVPPERDPRGYYYPMLCPRTTTRRAGRPRKETSASRQNDIVSCLRFVVVGSCWLPAIFCCWCVGDRWCLCVWFLYALYCAFSKHLKRQLISFNSCLYQDPDQMLQVPSVNSISPDIFRC